jgi:hypothetical protein
MLAFELPLNVPANSALAPHALRVPDVAVQLLDRIPGQYPQTHFPLRK